MMKIKSIIAVFSLIFAGAIVLTGCGGTQATKEAAKPDQIVIGVQTIPSGEPVVKAQYEKEFGTKVIVKQFDSGRDVNTAMAAGSIDIAILGSAPASIGIAKGIPYEVFWIHDIEGDNEALAVKNEANVQNIQGLKGKKIATPAGSTAHYSLLNALKAAGVSASEVTILDMQPPEILAAWQRGDIDGAYVWAPAVNELEKDGTVLTDSEKVGQWGAPTLDVWVVRKDFAEKHPEVVKAFAKSAIDAQQPYISNPDEWLKQPANLEKLSRLSGVPEADVPGLVKGNTYLTPAQQVQQLTGPVNKAIVDTATFLKEQGKVPAVAADYSQYVTDRFVK